MKKVSFSVLLMLLAVVTVSAQSKKEMQETINELNQNIGELKARTSMLEQQLQEAKQTIATLNQQDAGFINFQDPQFVKYLIETYG